MQSYLLCKQNKKEEKLQTNFDNPEVIEEIDVLRHMKMTIIKLSEEKTLTKKVKK